MTQLDAIDAGYPGAPLFKLAQEEDRVCLLWPDGTRTQIEGNRRSVEVRAIYLITKLTNEWVARTNA